MTILTTLLQLPGGKIVADGIVAAAVSGNPAITAFLVSLLILSWMGFIFVVKYLVKEKKEALSCQLESSAEKSAIDIGVQQKITAGKDEVIKTQDGEIKYLREKLEDKTEENAMILKDNAEAFKQLASKINQFSEGQVALSGYLRENHLDLKLFIQTTYDK